MQDLDQFSKRIFDFVSKALIQELRRQGHVLTGRLIESFEIETKKQTDGISLDFLMLVYGRSLNDGIAPSRIPYSVGSGRGGKSKYIQGLIDFALKKFTADKKEATSIAFAIAAKHKKKGYPLTGKLHFIDNVLESQQSQIEALISAYIEETILRIIQQQLNYANN